MRVLIVDDEEPARHRLAKLLQPCPEVEVVGQAGNGEEAIEKIGQLRPDLVFLDIQMPGCSGLEVAASLPSPSPRIVFCTAFDEYAVEAFEAQALDYLLKPVTRGRLRKTLDRARLGQPRPDAGEPGRAARLVAGKVRFLARRRGRVHVISEERVLYFGTEDGLSTLHTLEGQYWVEPTLSQLEDRVDQSRFQRISRSAIVQLDSIREMAPLIGGIGQVVLSNGVRLEVSRRRLKGLLSRLQGETG